MSCARMDVWCRLAVEQACHAAVRKLLLPPQVQACRDDIKKYCKKVGPGGDPLELLDCLRRSKKKLGLAPAA